MQIPFETRPAWRGFIPLLAITTLLVCAAIAILVASFVTESVSDPVGRVGALVLVVSAMGVLGVVLERRYAHKYVVEKNRLMEQIGIFSVRQQSISTRAIRSVGLEQSVVQRMLGLGNLQFFTAGTNEAEVRFNGVTDPERIKRLIREMTDADIDNGGHRGVDVEED